MDDLQEKVIEGLEHCDKYGYCTDKQCPYYENADCHELLRREVFSLLKAQEPRVMTLEELLNLPKDMPIFIEEDNDDCGWNVFYEIDEEHDVCFCGFQARPIFYLSKSYGKSWRCWTARPTDEQREKVKWDD